MRVWIIETGEPIPGIDGDVRDWRAWMLIKALVNRGHMVTWWASTFDHAAKRYRFDGPRVVETIPGLQIRLLHGPGYNRNVSPKRFWHQRVIAHSFACEAATCPNPDLIFCSVPTPELAEQAGLAGQLHHLPVILDVRDQWPDIYLMAFPQVLRGLARLAMVLEFRRIRRACQAATAITAVSETYLQWALDCAGRTRREMDGVFPLGYRMPSTNVQHETGVADMQAKHSIRHDALVVTFIGTFGASYDLETVVKAAQVLQADGVSDVQILLVGDGDKGPRLRKMAHGLSNIIFTGWLDQSAILTVLRLSSVGLAAYTGEALQSLPNKPFEYMAMGLPLLSSLRGELETLIHDDQIGLQYQAGDVDSLVGKIRWLAANPDTRREMGRRARELFEERFSADVIYPKLAQHLENVVGR